MAEGERRGVATGTSQRAARETFSSLSAPNYRLFFWGQLVSVCGTWMQTVAQSFLVLQLTGSGTALGLATGARFLPILLLAPWGGLVADRLDKRRILYVTQSLSGLLALALGVLVGTGAIRMWMVYLLALALGTVNAFDNPARQALISELVPSSLLRNAITLNSVTMNLARVFGAALGGGIASLLGLALCFDVNAISFAAVVLSLALMSADLIRRRERGGRERGQIRAGLSYIRTEPELLVPLLMVAVVGALAWEFQISLPLVARSVFHGGVAMYGVMSAVMGAGAVAGGLITASRKQVSGRGLAIAAIGWGAAITVAALAPNLAVEYAALVFVGYGSISFNSMAKTALQLSAAPGMRGRVMSLWAVAWQGSTPIGGPLVGWVGQELGARWSLLVGGLPTIALGLLAYPVLTRMSAARAGQAGPADQEAVPADAEAAPLPSQSDEPDPSRPGRELQDGVRPGP
jgi:MFS family permease